MIITTARQLKDKISNMSNGDSTKAQTLIRKYMMERFLERIEKSRFRNNFILKGGMLVSAIVGVESRATMDIDTTVRHIVLNVDDAETIISELINIDLNDGMHYKIRRIEEITEEHDYSGVRVTLSVNLEKIRDTIKIDITTGDQITPSAVEFSYPTIFGDRVINIWSYNIETLLAEKLETVLARSTFNTRMRDFYDIHILWTEQRESIDVDILKTAILQVMKSRGTEDLIPDAEDILNNISESLNMYDNWNNYQRNSYYVGDITWEEVFRTVEALLLDELEITEMQDMGFIMM